MFYATLRVPAMGTKIMAYRDLVEGPLRPDGRSWAIVGEGEDGAGILEFECGRPGVVRRKAVSLGIGCDIERASVAREEPVQQPPTRRIGQRLEDQVIVAHGVI